MLLENKEIQFITNQDDSTVYETLKGLFANCKSFCLSVAFISFSGYQLLIDTLTEMEEKGIKGKVLTSDYLGFTDPVSINRLHQFKNIQLKMYQVNQKTAGFHSKGYIFEYDDCYKILIGSANITQSALKSNIEWNLQIISKKDNKVVENILKEFDILMNQATTVTDEFVEKYENYYQKIKKIRSSAELDAEGIVLVPNYFQELALERLKELRQQGKNKAIAIGSTGIGKTFFAVFDVLQFEPKRVLYLVHNENILKSAKASFERVIKTKKYGFFSGGKKEINEDFLFSTVQTMSKDNNLSLFHDDTFDYIIYDEAHRATSPSYQKIMNYFNPKFMLGLTATPDRCDGENVYKLFDYNIASDIRMEEALNHDLLCPFHYFGIRDNVDLSNIDYRNVDKIADALMAAQDRVSFIISKMEHYGHDGEKRKALGFCQNKKHAKFMTDAFNLAGYPSVCLTGEDSLETREEYIKKLQDENDKIQVIFTVDIFNEGVDIPCINLILMLRPTASPIIFTQQLGRGLRKAQSKEFLTVLDFISNYNRNYMIALALSGKQYDKDGVIVRAKNNFNNLRGNTNIELDPITKQEIINQLNNTNFNELKYLRQSYNEYSNYKGKKILNLIDFFSCDNAPDPVKYINYAGHYLAFIEKVLGENKYNLNLEENQLLKYFSNLMPLRRINEFLLLKMILLNENVKFEDFFIELQKLVDNLDVASARHTFNSFKGDYLDKEEFKKYGNYFEIRDDIISFSLKTKDILQNKDVFLHLLDLTEYGILRYLDDFKNINYGLPFLKIYESYKMRNMGKLSNYTKIESSIRGQGVWHDSYDNYYLFADINKSEGIKDSLNYDDYFKSNRIFHWQSPNGTTQDSKEGIIFTKGTKPLHLFVRKDKKENMYFIYVGKVRPIYYDGNKPITIDFELEHELPKTIFEEMQKVKKI